MGFVAAGLLAGFLVFMPYWRQKFSGEGNLKAATFHYSYFSQPAFFNDAYAAAKPQAYNPYIKGIMVNHHLLAGNFIAEAFNVIATNALVTILLVSPNHFSAGKAAFITSNGQWQTPYGVLQPESESVKKIAAANLAAVEESPFGQEHGVSGIVAFIKKSLPNAKVIPVIIRNNVSVGDAQKIADQYFRILPKNTLVVASFDFSHYLTHQAADFHDLENLSDVESFNYSAMAGLDIDSRPGLAFSQKLLQDYGAGKFNLLEHSNSAALTKQEDTLETTSYITGYFTPGTPSAASINTTLALPPVAASQIVTGSLNRYNKNWSVEYLERLFSGQDKTIVGVSGASQATADIFKRYGVTDIITNQNFIQVTPNITINDHSKIDSITLKSGQITISRKNNLLSDAILKNGGSSVAYGFALSGTILTITIMPIGVEGGIAKLLVGKQSGIVLADIAARSPPQLSAEITSGKITINNFLYGN